MHYSCTKKILTGDITDKRFTQQKISLLTITQGIQEECHCQWRIDGERNYFKSEVPKINVNT